MKLKKIKRELKAQRLCMEALEAAVAQSEDYVNTQLSAIHGRIGSIRAVLKKHNLLVDELPTNNSGKSRGWPTKGAK